MNYTVSSADLPEQHAAVVRGQVSHDGIGEFLGTAFGEAIAALQTQGIEVSGAPFARYRMTAEGWDIEAGFPTAAPVTTDGTVHPSSLPGGHAARVIHTGAYSEVAGAYEAGERWIAENGFRPSGVPWESYLDEPSVPEPRTAVFLPCVEAHR